MDLASTNSPAAFSVEAKRKKKREMHLYSHCGTGKQQQQTIDCFWTTIWPSLEALGWKKVERTGFHAGSIFFLPPGVDTATGTRGTDFYDRIHDVINRVSERKTPDEAAVADAYEEHKKLFAQEDGGEEEKQQHVSPPSLRNSVVHRHDDDEDEDVARTPLSQSSSVQLDLSWKLGGRDFPKRSSIVGSDHQATQLPKAGSYSPEKDNSDQYCDLIWCPDEAKIKGVPLDRNEHILGLQPHSKKQQALELLAQRGYDVTAFEEALDKVPVDNGSDWSPEFKAKFHYEIFRLRKDLKALCKSMNIPMKTCLSYYLGVYKASDDYRLLKIVCQEERDGKKDELDYGVDSCTVCGDGGSLLICDGCEKEFHMNCLRPPLKTVPEGLWQCDECVDKKLLAARNWLLRNPRLFQPESSQKDGDAMDTDDDGDARSMDTDTDSDRIVLRPTDPVLAAVEQFADAIGRALSTTSEQ